MVKVESLTREEIVLREKKSKLLELTREFLGPMGKIRIIDSENANSFSLRHQAMGNSDYPVTVDVSQNKIFVRYPAYFEEVLSLARKYETNTREEFTVKKEYR